MMSVEVGYASSVSPEFFSPKESRRRCCCCCDVVVVGLYQLVSSSLSLSFKIPQSYFICYLSGVKETAKNGGGNGESSSWGVVAMAETHAPPPPPGRGASLLPIQPSFFSVHFLMQMTARSDPPLGL
jgi:uncharacterized membrane protein